MKYGEYIRKAKADYWRKLFDETGGNVIAMSAASKVNRTDVYNHLRRCGIGPIRRYGGNSEWRELGR